MSQFKNLLMQKKSTQRNYYCEVEYIQSDGNQYIDLNFGLTTPTKYKWRAVYTPTTVSTSTLCGTSNGVNGWTGQEWKLGDANRFFIGNAGSGYNLDNGIYRLAGIKSDFTCDIQGTNVYLTCKQNGVETTQTISNVATSSISSNNWYLFAYYYGTSVTGLISSKLNIFQIWDNDVLVRDMMPVLDWNLTPCMYDKIDGKLYYNAGTGSFTYGHEIHYVDWLESTGTQYIDLGFTPQDIDKIEVKAQASQGSHAILGCGTTDLSDDRVQLWADVNYYISRIGDKSVASQVRINTVATLGLDLLNKKVIFNGIESNCPYTTSLSTKNIYLFGRNTIPRDPLRFFYGKIFYSKAWKNGKLICDMYPAVNENGEGFMFDKVTHTIFYNQGTGAFEYPDVEIEYLTASDQQSWIDTGVLYNGSSKVEITLKCLTGSQFAIFGSKKEYFSLDKFTIYTMQDFNNFNKLQVDYGNQNIVFDSIDGFYSKIKNTLSLSSEGFKVNGVQKGITVTPQVFEGEVSVFLFAVDLNNAAQLPSKGMNCYGCKFWQDGTTLTFDYIPVIHNGVLCMYDNVTNTYKSNAGTGAFTGGKIKENGRYPNEI